MQNNIIAQLKNCNYINLINSLVFFLQFIIVEQNCYKFLFIIYRNKKQLNIATIEFKNFPTYI